MEKFSRYELKSYQTDYYDEEASNTITVPAFGVLNIPSSTTEKIREEANTYLNNKGWITAGPKGSNMWLF